MAPSTTRKSRLRVRGRRHALEPPTPPSRGPAAPRSLSPAPVPELVDDLISEVLIRLPPNDTASLANASLVCKRWRRIVSDPGFGRRLHELLQHRAHPPILGGFLYNMSSAWISTFVPTSSLYLHHAEDARHRDWRALEGRHGRILLHGVPKDGWTTPLEAGLFVWDPATDHCTALPNLPREAYAGSLMSWNATVLCAAGSVACDGRRCGRKPFIVVVVGGDMLMRKYSCVYSSEDGTWSNRRYKPRDVWGPHCDIDMAAPTALVGDALYFSDQSGNGVIKFSLDTREMSTIPLPSDCLGKRIVLMTTEGGGRLGFAAMLLDSELFLCSSVVSPDGEVVGWEISRVIELERVLSVGADSSLLGSLAVVGAADDIGVIFLRTGDGGIFTFDLNSEHVKKVYKGTCIHRVFPCVSFNS